MSTLATRAIADLHLGATAHAMSPRSSTVTAGGIAGRTRAVRIGPGGGRKGGGKVSHGSRGPPLLMLLGDPALTLTFDDISPGSNEPADVIELSVVILSSDFGFCV